MSSREFPRAFAACVLAMLLGLVSVISLQAAWPRLVMVHGGPLENRVIIDDLEGIQEIMKWDVPYDAGDLDSRSFLDLSLFWKATLGSGEELFSWDETPIAELQPEDATTDVIIPTRGRFYPACGITPAVIALDTYEFVDDDSFRTRDVVRTWIVSDAALSVFERFGVPVVSECDRG